ncbi:MAG: efflux RND transporter periplasmic adaptor subunit [Myxococcota bacterium]
MLATVGCSETASTEPRVPADAAPVAVAPGSRERDERPGVILSQHQIEARTKATAVLDALLVQPGDRVVPGQVLARLDTSDAQAELDVARAELQAAKVERDAAQLDAQAADASRLRTKALLREGVVSQDDFDAATLAAQQARAQVQEARAKIAGLEARVRRLRRAVDERELTATRAGLVSACPVAPGELISPTTTVVQLLAGDAMRVRFAIEPGDRARWSVGRVLHGRSDDATRAFTAKVTAVAPNVDVATQMVFVDGQLDDGVHALPDGLAVWIRASTKDEDHEGP